MNSLRNYHSSKVIVGKYIYLYFLYAYIVYEILKTLYWLNNSLHLYLLSIIPRIVEIQE